MAIPSVQIDRIVSGNLVSHYHEISDLPDLTSPYLFKGTVASSVQLRAVEALAGLTNGWSYRVTSGFDHNGVITTVALGSSGGLGYAVNDIVAINGGSNGSIKVLTIGALGVVTSLELHNSGDGYTAGVDQATTHATGAGLLVTTTCDNVHYYANDEIAWNGSTWTNLGQQVAESNIIYVGKHGDDDNTGRRISDALLTIAAAITEAGKMTPSAVNRFVIYICDAGIYSENVPLGNYMSLFGPNATITGLITTATETFVRLARSRNTGAANITQTAGTALSYIDIDSIVNTNTACIVMSNGDMEIAIKEMYTVNANTIELSGGVLYGRCSFIGASNGSVLNATSTAYLNCDYISQTGAGAAVTLVGTTARIVSGIISANVVYNINAASTLYLNCLNITGTETIAAGGQVYKTAILARTSINESAHVVQNGTNSTASLQATVYNDQETGGYAPSLYLNKSHTDTLNGYVATIDTEELGYIYFRGVNTSPNIALGAQIRAIQSGAAGATYSPTNLFLETCTGAAINSNQLVLNTSGYVGIGTSSPATILHAQSALTTSPRGIMSSQHNNGVSGAMIQLRKTRGTNAAQTLITSGDILGAITSSGMVVTGTQEVLDAARIDFVSSGTVATTRLPSEIQFWTTPDAAPSTAVNRMTITSAGKVNIGTLTGTVTEFVNIANSSSSFLSLHNESQTSNVTLTAFDTIANLISPKTAVNIRAMGGTGGVFQANYSAINTTPVFTYTCVTTKNIAMTTKPYYLFCAQKGTAASTVTAIAATDIFLQYETGASPGGGTTLYSMFGSGKIILQPALSTSAPTYDLSFGGNAAKTMGLERTTIAATAGFGFTINAGGAIAGTANNGGMLQLNPGLSISTGFTSVRAGRYSRATAGTADNTISDAFAVMSSKILTDNTDTILFSIVVAVGTSVGCTFAYTIICDDATGGDNDTQCESGIVLVSAGNSGAASTTVTKLGSNQNLTSDTLTVTFDSSVVGTTVNIRVKSNSDYDDPSTISYNIINISSTTLTQV